MLTSENLRTELLNLWGGRDFPTKAILLVTHNIEEAVQMADRIFVLTSNPGRLRAEIPICCRVPRNRRSPEFEALVDHIYGLMTGRDAVEEARSGPPVEPRMASPLELPLPHASVGGLAGLVEILGQLGGRADLPELAQLLTFEVDDLLPLVDAADLLGFAEVADADLTVTPIGKEWMEADILSSKEIFAERARDRAPLVRAIVRALDQTKDGTINAAVLPRPAGAALRRGRSAGPAGDRHRLGALRRAVRLRRQHRRLQLVAGAELRADRRPARARRPLGQAWRVSV